VSENYFSVLGLPIVRGRAFTPEEVRNQLSGPRTAIVSETTARNLWSGVDPIGRTLLAGKEMLEVVGVVKDAQLMALGRIDAYSVYVPGPWGDLLVRSRFDVTTTISNIRAAVRAIDPVLVLTVLPLEANLGRSRGISGTVTALFGALGVLALLLAPLPHREFRVSYTPVRTDASAGDIVDGCAVGKLLT
jgi:hypothetical protein